MVSATQQTPTRAGRSVPTHWWNGLARLVDYHAIAYRRTWKGSVVGSFVTPFLYVLAMGVVLGRFVSVSSGGFDGAPTYLAFVVPGLLAAQTMQLVFGETTYPVLGSLKWHRVYFSMAATSLRIRDLVNGHLAFVVFRVLTSSAVFTIVVAFFGVYGSVGGALLALLVQALVGLAFAAPIYGFSAGLRDESAFSLLFRLGMLPLFLFSGAFYPISTLGPVLAWIARFTPLWHGVDLTRMFALGHVHVGALLVHVAYLVLLTVAGYLWGLRRLTRRLVV